MTILDKVDWETVPWWKMVLVRLFGKKSIGIDVGSKRTMIATVYEYRGGIYVDSVREADE